MVTLKDILIKKTYIDPTLLKLTKIVHLTWSENCISAVSYVADAQITHFESLQRYENRSKLLRYELKIPDGADLSKNHMLFSL